MPPLLSLGELLEFARKHLAFSSTALPEPWPGCVLVLSVAHGDESATVFHIKAHNFHSAWREASTRTRQWAWARGVDSAFVRVDWAEEVTLYPAGHYLNAHTIAQLHQGNCALADLGCEQLLLLQQALLTPTSEQASWAAHILAGKTTPEPFLVLHMRGIFLQPQSTGVVHIPRSGLTPNGSKQAPLGMDLRQRHASKDVITGLIAQQMPSGGWPATHSLIEHIHIQYSLLLALRAKHDSTQSRPNTVTLESIAKAIAQASEYTLQQPLQTPHEQACALLVLSLSMQVLRELRQPLSALQAELHARLHQITPTWHLPAAPRRSPAEQLSHPDPIHILQQLALRAHAAHCVDDTNTRTEKDSGAAFSGAWLQQLQQHFVNANADQTSATWLCIALIEALQDAGPTPPGTAQHRHTRKRTVEQLKALQQRLIWPETAFYLTTRQPQWALFMAQQPPMEPGMPRAAEQACLLNQTIACFALLEWLDASTASPPNTAATRQISPISTRHQPMSWSGQCLAKLTAGQWRLPPGVAAPASVSGLAVTRQSHWYGGAVLVRHDGDTLGVPPAVTSALHPSALIQVLGHKNLRTSLPVLEIPDLPAALSRLAARARQRVRAKVIAVTGCVGKTSTLRMLAQCLLGSSSPQQEAIVQHDPMLQMINWSTTAPWCLVELPLEQAPQSLRLIKPDVLVVTNLPAAVTDHPQQLASAQQTLLDLLACMPSDSVLVFNNALLPQPPLQTMAAHGRIQLCCFGPHDTATIHEHGYAKNGLLQVQLRSHPAPTDAAKTLQVQLQANGHHMALNAQATLAVLHAMHLPLTLNAASLSQWQPMPGAGQSELLTENRVLLDHCNTSELLAVQAAFAQLLSHAPQANQRLIVFGGIKPRADSADSLPMAQLQLATLLRSTEARRVLLYGQAMAELAQQLQDQDHVSWYEDLNVLIQSLLRALQPQDTVLLVGRAIVNLHLVADALRESLDEHF